MPQFAHPHWSCGLAGRDLGEPLIRLPAMCFGGCVSSAKFRCGTGENWLFSLPGGQQWSLHGYMRHVRAFLQTTRRMLQAARLLLGWRRSECESQAFPPLKFYREPDEALQQARCPTMCATARKEPNLASSTEQYPPPKLCFFFLYNKASFQKWSF